jgi:hypothetical protein
MRTTILHLQITEKGVHTHVKELEPAGSRRTPKSWAANVHDSIRKSAEIAAPRNEVKPMSFSARRCVVQARYAVSAGGEVDKSAEIRYNPSHMKKAGKGTSSGSVYGKESFRPV